MKAFVRVFVLLTGLVVLSCAGSGLSKEQLKALETLAENGDAEAARQLADYYDTVPLPLTPMEFAQLSEKTDLSLREAKKMEEYLTIQQNAEKWAALAEELENPAVPEALSDEDLNKLTKELVSILKQEKAGGQLDEAPYVALLVDSLGFSRDQEDFSKGEGIRISLLKDSPRAWSREVTVEADSPQILWRMVVLFQECGLQPVGGTSTRLEGDGLTVFADKDRLAIGY